MKAKKKRKKEILISFFLLEREREKGRESELSKLLSMIYKDRLVGIHRAKNESSSTRRVLRVGTKITGFRRRFKQGVQEIKGFGFRKCPRDFLKFLLRSKRKGFFLLWFIFHSRDCLVGF